MQSGSSRSRRRAVEKGGSAMDVRFQQLNPGSCWSFLVGAPDGTAVAIVDPVLEHMPDYLALLAREGLRLTHAIDTHTHADHISGGAALRDQTGYDYLMYARAPVRCANVRVDDGYQATLAGVPMRFLHTPATPRTRSPSSCPTVSSPATCCSSTTAAPVATTCQAATPSSISPASSAC